ncbi:N-acetyltransferase 9-like protein isoform X2 [Tubulanus polymorphus]
MSSAELRELTASERLSLDEEYNMQKSWLNDDNKCTFIVLTSEVYKEELQNEVESMIGDVNLFFNDVDDKQSAEIELMIAENDYRGKGLGKEALVAMMHYGIQELHVKTFTAKIGYANEISQNLFKKFNFVEVSRSDVFKEITYSFAISDETKKSLKTRTNELKIVNVDYPSDS